MRKILPLLILLALIFVGRIPLDEWEQMSSTEQKEQILFTEMYFSYRYPSCIGWSIDYDKVNKDVLLTINCQAFQGEDGKIYPLN